MLGDLSIPQISSRTPGGGDALMCAIFTRDVTKIAADTKLRVDSSDDLIVQVEIAPIADAIY